MVEAGKGAIGPFALQVLEIGEECHIQLDAALVDIDADALVSGVDELARLARVDKAAKAVDAIADVIELA